VTFAIGGRQGRPVYEAIKVLAAEADALSIAVSYVQLSGWELLADAIPAAKLTRTRILCTDQLWVAWLKHADENDLIAINPTGRLVRGRKAFETFWTFPAEVTDFYLEEAEGAKAGTRELCQTIELLANAGRALPSLSLEDVATLSTILGATAERGSLRQ
jgi:hypothetical protein